MLRTPKHLKKVEGNSEQVDSDHTHVITTDCYYTCMTAFRGDNFMCVPRLVVKHAIHLIEVGCFLSASGYLSSIS